MPDPVFATHIQFFGDGEKRFALTPELIRELERVTGTGIGALFRRVLGGTYFLHDLTESIRLALIGGGSSPAEAAALVKVYGARPLAETLPLALAILEGVFAGEPKVKPKRGRKK